MHHECGIDLLDFFRGRYSWRKLFSLISLLPSRSKLGIAQAEDEDFAERILKLREDDDASGTPPLESFTPEVAAITNLLDRVGEVASLLETLITHQAPKQVQSSPRPVTAFDRVRQRMAWDVHTELVDEVEEARQRRLRR